MKTLSTCSFVLMLFFLNSARGESRLVGTWVSQSGDATWARLEISPDLLVTAYRTCAPDKSCEGRTEFNLVSYGPLSGLHHMGTGEIIDRHSKTTATQILEVRSGRLFLKEYSQPLAVKHKAYKELKTTFRMVSGAASTSRTKR
ncbi:hypothetical protein ACLWBD_13005 [Bdellovibrio sp. HCB117]|uniref:hypothetical protein n=1 Tax=Bdellovibrio sp. HCB117 TaxID=3394359 RepID=UPI0039B4D2F9